MKSIGEYESNLSKTRYQAFVDEGEIITVPVYVFTNKGTVSGIWDEESFSKSFTKIK